MSISVRCAGCGKQYHVQDSMAGKTAKCRCGHSFRVEAAANPPSQPHPVPPTQSAAGPLGQFNAAADWLGEELTVGSPGISNAGALENAALPAVAAPLAPLSSPRSSRKSGGSARWRLPAVVSAVAIAVVVVLVGGYFAVRAIRNQIALREFQEKMKSPEFREKFMGEKQGWQFYDDVGGGAFRVEVPGPPKTQFQTVNSAAGPLSVVVTQAERGKDESFLVSHTMLFLPNPNASLPLEPMVEAMLTNMNARVASKRSFDFEGSQAVEADFQGKDRPFSGRSWFIMTRNRLYQVAWIASPPKPLNDEAKRFFASFKLTLPPPPAATNQPSK